MSFETRNIEVVLYNLLKNVQCTLIMKPSYTWQIQYFKHQYFKHQQKDQWEQARLPAKILNLCTILSATTVQLSNF